MRVWRHSGRGAMNKAAGLPFVQSRQPSREWEGNPEGERMARSRGGVRIRQASPGSHGGPGRAAAPRPDQTRRLSTKPPHVGRPFLCA